KDVTAANLITANTSPNTPGNGAILTNYNLPATASGAGTISPKNLTLAIVGNPNKPAYDGNANINTLTPANFSITGLVGLETIQINQTLGTFNSKDVGGATLSTGGTS